MNSQSTFRSAILSGIAVAIAGWGYLACTSKGLEILGAVMFSFGLLTVVNYKLKLYTGTAGFVPLRYEDGRSRWLKAIGELLSDKTDDKILLYAAETTLQLYMAESSEHMREMYNVAYSLPNSAKVIYHTITGKLEEIFKEFLPTWETKDFYEREISSAGIMRNHISVPCDIYFTMERKINSFLESTFLLYRVPDEKIREAIEFVSGFDWKTISEKVIENMLSYLESKT